MQAMEATTHAMQAPWTMGYHPAMLAAATPWTGPLGAAAPFLQPGALAGPVPLQAYQQLAIQFQALPGVGQMVPGMAQAYPGMMQAVPGIAQAYPGMMQVYPGMMQAAPGIAQAFPGVAQVYPGMMQAAPGIAQAFPGVAQAVPQKIAPAAISPLGVTPQLAGALMAPMRLSAGQLGLAVAGLGTGMEIPETQGVWRIPGFSFSLDTPLLQGALNWPGIQGLLHWPGMQGLLRLPGFGMSAAPDSAATIRWPGAQAQSGAMPDSPAE